MDIPSATEIPVVAYVLKLKFRDNNILHLTGLLEKTQFCKIIFADLSFKLHVAEAHLASVL